jgi:glycine/D-amino acid oxidase-like deaminating enzyme
MNGLSADVVVVGGGPAGTAAAIELRRRGVDRVLLIDREPELGGATRHCRHSPFGLREFGRVYFGAAYSRRLADQASWCGPDTRSSVSTTTAASWSPMSAVSRP